MSKLGGVVPITVVPSLPSRNKTFVIVIKNKVGAVIKVFCSCPGFLDFFTLFQIACPEL